MISNSYVIPLRQFGETIRRLVKTFMENIRYTTYEGIPLVFLDGPKPEFVYLGGHVNGLTEALVSHLGAGKKYKEWTLANMAANFVTFTYLGEDLDPFNIGNYSSEKQLPFWKEFVREKSDAIKAFEAAREVRGQTKAGTEELKARIRPILAKHFPADAETRTLNRQQAVDLVTATMRKARADIAADSILAQRLSSKVYLDYYRETNHLLQTYLDWYESRPKSINGD